MSDADPAMPRDERGRYELYARLRALRDHFPRRFAATAGARGERLLAALEPHIVERGYYVKLRRIALARLAAGEPITFAGFEPP